MADAEKTKSFYNSVIPGDWEVKELMSLGRVSSGGTPDTENDEYWNGDINWCTPTDITALKDSKYIGQTVVKISEKGLKNSSAILLPKGTVIVCTRATIGKAAISTEEISTNQGFKNIVPDNKKVDVEYLYYSIIDSEHQLVRLGNGSTFLEVPKRDFEKFKIPVPPLAEQKAIGYVLGLMDSAINQNNQLIAQKELRKKWLMQNLLTGKKRLKEFGGEWEEEKLGKLFTHIKDINDGGDAHSIMTISSRLGLISQEDKFDRVIAGDSLKKYTQLKKNDFAYNKGNSKSYPMGCIYQLEEKPSALVPFVYICFSPTKLIDPKFYKHWFLGHGLDRQLKRIITSGARGDGLLNVNVHDFFKLQTVFPPLEEQTAIAQVLQAADKEIELLKTKTEKLLEQKKGMMQQLLTGKKRLFV